MKKTIAFFFGLSPFFAPAQNLLLEWVQRNPGSTNGSLVYNVTTDLNGDVILSGIFTGTCDFDPASSVTYNLTSLGGWDIFVQKLDSEGNFKWAVRFGSSAALPSFELPTYTTTDIHGNIYTSGVVAGNTDFDPSPTGSYVLSSGDGGFVQKLDSAGNFKWARKFFAGSTLCAAFQCAVDENENVYVTGNFDDSPYYTIDGTTYMLVSNGQRDVFVCKLNAAGNIRWLKNLGGVQEDFGHSIKLGSDHRLYLGGVFENTVDFDYGPGTYSLTSVGGKDLFVQKLDTSGNMIWTKQTGNASSDSQHLLSLDSQNNVYSCGIFMNPIDMDPDTGNTYLLNPAGYMNVFMRKLNEDGNFIWANAISGTTAFGIYNLYCDGLSNVYATGSYKGTADFDPGPAVQARTAAGAEDFFAYKLDSTGNFAWALTNGNTNTDIMSGLTVTPDNQHIYFGGCYTNTVDFDPGTGVNTMTSLASGASGYEMFIMKMYQCSINNTITQTGAQLTANAGDSWQWLDCNNAYASVTGANAQSFTPAVNGTYAVQIMEGSCIDTSACYTITNAGINTFTNNEAARVFPSPTTGIFYIENHTGKLSAIVITDLCGRTVYQNPSPQNKFNAVHLVAPEGIYLVSIITDQQTFTSRIVKE